MKRYKKLLANNEYMKVVIAGWFNTFGDTFDALALSWFVYEITGSKLWFAINFTINAIPNLFIQPFLGVLIEKMSKKWVMVIADFGRVVLVGVLLVLASLGDVNPYIVLIFSFLMTCMEAFRQPAAMAMTPSILDPEEFDISQSFKNTTSTLVQVIATAAAGVVIVQMGVKAALFIDFIAFIISGSVLMLLKQNYKKVTDKKNTYVSDLKEGWKAFINHDFILTLALLGCVIQLLFNGMNVMFTPYAVEVLGKQPDFVSYFMTVNLIATILGSILYPMLHKKLSNRMLFGLSGIVCGVAFIGIAYLSMTQQLMLAALVVASIFGLALGVFQPALSVSFMSSVDKDVISRMAALFNALIYAAQPMGSVLISILMLSIPMARIYSIYGIILILVFLVFLKIKRFRKMG